MTGAEIKQAALAEASRTRTSADAAQIIFGKTEVIYRYAGLEYREPIGDSNKSAAKDLLARKLRLPGSLAR